MQYVVGVAVNDVGLSREDKDLKTYKYRAYVVWQGMLIRCYKESERDKYKTYKGCKVCPRWRTFSNFLEDLPKIEGYDLWLNNPSKRIALDKDIKGKYHAYYCPHYCKFVTASENNREKYKRSGSIFNNNEFRKRHARNMGRKIFAINVYSGLVYEFYSIRECARILNAYCPSIRYALKNNGHIYRGYKFYYLEKETDSNANAIPA